MSEASLLFEIASLEELRKSQLLRRDELADLDEVLVSRRRACSLFALSIALAPMFAPPPRTAKSQTRKRKKDVNDGRRQVFKRKNYKGNTIMMSFVNIFNVFSSVLFAFGQFRLGGKTTSSLKTL